MPLGKKLTLKLALIMKGTALKWKRNTVSGHKFLSFFLLISFSIYLFLLHLPFALSDCPAVWFLKWLFEMLLIHRLITNYPSYCSVVSFLNGIPQAKQEMWVKTSNWTLMSSILLCFLFMNCIPHGIHLLCSFMGSFERTSYFNLCSFAFMLN